MNLGLWNRGQVIDPSWWVPKDGRTLDLDALNWRMWDSENGARAPNALTRSRPSGRGRRNPLGVWGALVDNEIGVDHDDVGTRLGLQIEPQATYNRVNSSLTGFVAGSPGTAPDGWSISAPGGLTRTLSLVTTSGRPKLRVHYAGAPSSNTQILLQTIPSLTLAAASGQVWTYGARFSCGGTGLDGNSLALNHWETDGSNNILRSGAVGGTSPLAHARRSATVTIGASTAYLRLLFGSGIITAGTTCDFWIEVECPTLTQTAFLPSEYLVGTSSAVRYADVVTVPAGGSWFNAAASTILLDIDPTYVASSVVLGLPAAANSFDETLYLSMGASTLALTVRVGAATVANISRTVAFGAPFKAALSLSASRARLVTTGQAVSTDAAVSLPGLTGEIRLGRNGWGSAAPTAPQYHRRLTYWPHDDFDDTALGALVA